MIVGETYLFRPGYIGSRALLCVAAYYSTVYKSWMYVLEGDIYDDYQLSYTPRSIVVADSGGKGLEDHYHVHQFEVFQNSW